MNFKFGTHASREIKSRRDRLKTVFENGRGQGHVIP